MDRFKVAELCHNVNKAYCESIGDNSQKAWKDAPAWQRESAVKGVEFHLTHPDSKPEDSHESWLKEKEAQGWKYGSLKNEELKTHPCYVPYDKLPTEQKSKDYIFLAICRFFNF